MGAPLRPSKGDDVVDEILEAVIVSEAVDFFTPGKRFRKAGRWALSGLVAIGIVALLVSQILTSSLVNQISKDQIGDYPPIWERHLVDFVPMILTPMS